MSQILKILFQTAYRKSGARDPYLEPRTRDPPPGIINLGPETHRWDTGPGNFKWDPPPGTFHLGSGTQDPIGGTLFKEQICRIKVRKPSLFIRAKFCVLF